MRKPLALAVLLSGFLITKAQAQSAAQTNAAALPPPGKITANFLVDTSATLMEGSSASNGEGLSFSGFYRFDLGVPLSRTLTANMRAGYSQEYSYVLPNQSSGDPTDIRLGLTQTWGEIRKDFTLAVGPFLNLPVSYETRRAGLQSSVGITTFAAQSVDRFTFMFGPRFVQNFHDVTFQLDGTPNLERTIAAMMIISYSITDDLILSAMFDPSLSWTYTGRTTGAYSLAYDMTYVLNPKTFLSLGVSNRASALKSNGLEYNYAFFDQRQFTAYFDIAFRL